MLAYRAANSSLFFVFGSGRSSMTSIRYSNFEIAFSIAQPIYLSFFAYFPGPFNQVSCTLHDDLAGRSFIKIFNFSTMSSWMTQMLQELLARFLPASELNADRVQSESLPNWFLVICMLIICGICIRLEDGDFYREFCVEVLLNFYSSTISFSRSYRC